MDEKLREAAERLRKIRMNQPPITREQALERFAEHRQAAAESRLALRVQPESGGAREQADEDLELDEDNKLKQSVKMETQQITEAIAALPTPPDFPDDVDDMSAEDLSELEARISSSRSAMAELSDKLSKLRGETKTASGAGVLP